MLKNLIHVEVEKIEGALAELESYHAGPTINAIRKAILSVREAARNIRQHSENAVQVGEGDIERFLGEVESEAGQAVSDVQGEAQKAEQAL